MEALRVDGLAGYAEHVERITATPASVERGLAFLLTRIGSWTNARFDQHLRDELGDEATDEVMAWLGTNVSPGLAKAQNGEPVYRALGNELKRRGHLSAPQTNLADPAQAMAEAFNVPTKTTAWTDEERAELAEQRERDHAAAYVKGPDGTPIQFVAARREHAPDCDSFDFDPEEQLGPDKPCNCGASK